MEEVIEETFAAVPEGWRERLRRGCLPGGEVGMVAARWRVCEWVAGAGGKESEEEAMEAVEAERDRERGKVIS